MLSNSKHFYCLSQLCARLCVKNICKQDYGNNINGVSSVLRNAFCSVAENVDESPELPDWVKFPGKDKGTKKSEDDDFLPPSVSYWIENHKVHDQGVDMKNIVNSIVESDTDKISKILNNRFESLDLVMKALDGCDLNDVSEGLVEQVLRRFSCEWMPAYGFFKWAELHKGIKHSADLYTLMVDNLGKTKKFEIMWELMEKMKCLEGYVTLDTMAKIMRRLARAGKYEDAIEAFDKIELFGVSKDITAMNMLMNALVKEGSVENSERVYLEFKERISPNLKTYNMLMHGWCKTRQMDKAMKTVDEMKKHGYCPDSVTYANFIEAYCREKDFRKVDETLAEMKRNGLHPNVVIYTIIMTALSRAKETDKALEIYEQMKKNNCCPDTTFYNAFISALSHGGRLKDSDAVFEDMLKQGVVPNVSTYNTLILIAANNSDEEKALNLLKKMEENLCKPDLNTYAPLLKMCCRLKRMKVLSFLLNHMFKNDVSVDHGTYSLLVNRLSKNGSLDRASSFFEEMVLKGFVPMDCTHEILVKEFDKKGMDEGKQRVEELMKRAKNPPRDLTVED